MFRDGATVEREAVERIRLGLEDLVKEAWALDSVGRSEDPALSPAVVCALGAAPGRRELKALRAALGSQATFCPSAPRKAFISEREFLSLFKYGAAAPLIPKTRRRSSGGKAFT